jgi:hypothetical protein
MRDFRDAKIMARALRDALNAKAIEITHSEALELIAKAFGYDNWNILSAKIDAAEPITRLLDAFKGKSTVEGAVVLDLIARAFGYENWNVLSAKIAATEPAAGGERAPSAEAQNDATPRNTLYCAFCGKSQHDVRKLIAGPTAFICDECVDICTTVVEPDEDLELFRLMKASEESGATAYPALLELARGTSTQELARYVERGRKGMERNRAALQDIERWRRDGGVSASEHVLAERQQEARRELKRYEDALNIATAVLGERRQ